MEATATPLYLRPEEIAETYRVSTSTVNRWLTIGITAWDAQGRKFRLRLKGMKVGSRWRIAPDALREFIAATNLDQAAISPSSETESQRIARVEACKARLREAGLLGDEK